MKDPHVAELRYHLVPEDPLITFTAPPKIVWPTPVGTFTVVNGEAVVELTRHYASPDAARRAVEPHLRAWELDAGLGAGFPLFHFRFVRARVVDRALPSAGNPAAYMTGTATVTATASVEAHLDRYPSPPAQFAADADIEAMWAHWKQYRHKPLHDFRALPHSR